MDLFEELDHVPGFYYLEDEFLLLHVVILLSLVRLLFQAAEFFLQFLHVLPLGRMRKRFLGYFPRDRLLYLLNLKLADFIQLIWPLLQIILFFESPFLAQLLLRHPQVG